MVGDQVGDTGGRPARGRRPCAHGDRPARLVEGDAAGGGEHDTQRVALVARRVGHPRGTAAPREQHAERGQTLAETDEQSVETVGGRRDEPRVVEEDLVDLLPQPEADRDGRVAPGGGRQHDGRHGRDGNRGPEDGRRDGPADPATHLGRDAVGEGLDGLLALAVGPDRGPCRHTRGGDVDRQTRGSGGPDAGQDGALHGEVLQRRRERRELQSRVESDEAHGDGDLTDLRRDPTQPVGRGLELVERHRQSSDATADPDLSHDRSPRPASHRR